MGFKCTTEPVKALSTFLSRDGDKNDEEILRKILTESQLPVTLLNYRCHTKFAEANYTANPNLQS